MTIVRELIKVLQELPEEAMDKEVMVFPDGNKPEFQHYDHVMFVDYNYMWQDESNKKVPVIHID